MDRGTSEPLPFAAVKIMTESDTIGTSTSYIGEFMVEIPREFAGDLSKLKVSCSYVGYKESGPINLTFKGNVAIVDVYFESNQQQELIGVKIGGPIDRLPDIVPIIGPPNLSIEIIREADYFRTETTVVDDDEF